MRKRTLKKVVINDFHMPKQRFLVFYFFKLNYLNNIKYYMKPDKDPKHAFLDNLREFFKKNEKDGEIYDFKGMQYRFGGLKVTSDYIFGKLWKLKKRSDKDFPWTGTDYQIKPHAGQDFKFLWFLINLKTNHMAIMDDDPEYPVNSARQVLQAWFDEFYGMKDGITLEFVKNKKDFLTQLRGAYKIVHAKLVVYPSNYDYDEISDALDKELKRLKIDKLEQDFKSDNGIKLDLDKPNSFASSLVQSLRGNGKDPIVTTSDEHGNEMIISNKMQKVRRRIEDSKIEDSLKETLIKSINDVLKELNGK